MGEGSGSDKALARVWVLAPGMPGSQGRVFSGWEGPGLMWVLGSSVQHWRGGLDPSIRHVLLSETLTSLSKKDRQTRRQEGERPRGCSQSIWEKQAGPASSSPACNAGKGPRGYEKPASPPQGI